MDSLTRLTCVASLSLFVGLLSSCESAAGTKRSRNGFLPQGIGALDGSHPESGRPRPAPVAAPQRSVVVSGPVRSVGTAARVPMVRGLSFRAQPLDEAFRSLSTVTEAPILVTPAARQVIAEERLVLDLDVSVALSLPRVLDLMTGMSEQLDHEYRDGIWQVGRRDEVLGGRRVSRILDVRDLVAPRTVFLPPAMTGIPNGELDGLGRSGSEAEDKVRAMQPDELVMLVQDSLGRKNFAPEGPVTLEFLDSGYLLLSGPQRAVERLSGRSGR